jgi:hypothetical protein
MTASRVDDLGGKGWYVSRFERWCICLSSKPLHNEYSYYYLFSWVLFTLFASFVFVYGAVCYQPLGSCLSAFSIKKWTELKYSWLFITNKCTWC